MNILFTTLSTRSKNPHTCYYITDNCKDPEKKGKYDTWCSGIHQQEPGAKKFLAEEKIDRIVMFGSKETYDPDADKRLLKSDSVLKDWVGQLNNISVEEMNKLSSLRFLVCRLADFVYNKDYSEITDSAYAADKVYHIHYNVLEKLTPSANSKNGSISFIFIPDEIENQSNDNGKNENQNKNKSKTENLKALIDELKGKDSKHFNHLYMDMQGGERTKIYVNNALLQLLSSQKSEEDENNPQNANSVYYTTLERVVATQFDPRAVFDENKNRIVDETNRYRIVDLVSGMNAFFKFGKSDLLKDYLEKLKQEAGFAVDENVDELIKRICDIDNAITFCRIKESSDEENKEIKSGTIYLMDAIKGLQAIIDKS